MCEQCQIQVKFTFYPIFCSLIFLQNFHVSVLPDHKVRLRAQRKIKAGEEITIQYLSFMYGHLRRKSDIRDCWLFDCSCERCVDPTELGSKMSAHRCSLDDCNGDVLPVHGSDFVIDDWICYKCGKKYGILDFLCFFKGYFLRV